MTGADRERLYLYQLPDPLNDPDPVPVAQRSLDGGKTWDDLALPTCRVAESRLAASHVRVEALAISCGSVVYTSLNDGLTWDLRTEVPPSDPGTAQTPIELIADTGGLDRVLVPPIGVLFALDFAASAPRPYLISKCKVVEKAASNLRANGDEARSGFPWPAACVCSLTYSALGSWAARRW